MRRNFRSVRLTITVCCALTLLCGLPLLAQQSAPVPARILSAKKVFISNAGGEEWPSLDPLYKGGSDRAYDQFYAALKTWGHYELVADPADADLVFEISFSVAQFAQLAVHPYALSNPGCDPQFHFVIRDPKSGIALWGVVVHAQWAILQGNRDKNFDQGLATIVGDVQRISLSSSVSPDISKP